MSDKTEQPSATATVEEVVDKPTKEEKPVEKVENGDKVVDEKNGDSKEKISKSTDEEKPEENGDSESKEPTSIKRKSKGTDDTDSAPAAEGATPEKKAKLEDKPESEVKEATEVEA